MKKNTLKAFTLVEMLIVIVIIGILIAALMPRMQSAQGRARDVARKNDLSQIQQAIVTSQTDKGKWPGENATGGIQVKVIEQQLRSAGMTSVPRDPNQSNSYTGLNGTSVEGDYSYMVTDRNGVSQGGFVLMAKTEVEGGSNWVVCGGDELTDGKIAAGEDIKNILPCTTMNEGDSCSIVTGTQTCNYQNTSELRYILVY